MFMGLKGYKSTEDFHACDVLARARDAPPTTTMDATRLRQLALECGADDAGVVEIGHPDLDDQRADILAFYPRTKALLAVVCRMNRAPIRNLARSVADLEFHATGDDMNDVCRAVVTALEGESVPAVNPPMGFPMEADRWPEKMWVVSHKPVAVAAGLGQMGIHRNVIHPKFGSFILLGTILIEAEAFDLASCYTHNYGSSWAGSATGSSTSPTPAAAWPCGKRSPGRRPPRSGRVWPSVRTTRRRTAWPSARPAGT